MFNLFHDKKRGTISGNQMPDKSLETLRCLSDTDLHEFIAGWRPGTADHIAGMRELERRVRQPADLRSWIAIILSSIAVGISLIRVL